MGTTIRREPITTSIPASPDYRFLNITNFGGIQKSSNPFVVNSNTASDCLNVYVDEDNALSTRPRVSPKYDLLKLSGSTSILNNKVYALHDGYLLHRKPLFIGTSELYKFTENNGDLSSNAITGTNIPSTIYSLFEQNNKIYVLTGYNGYLQISNNKLEPVEAYVPTTTIGRNKRSEIRQADGTWSTKYDTAGAPYESLNILSNYYKESYFWDGTVSPESFKNKSSDVVENNYVEKSNLSFTSSSSYFTSDNTKILAYLKTCSEESTTRNYYIAYNYSGYSDYHVVVLATDKLNNLVLGESYPVPFEGLGYWSSGNTVPVSIAATPDGKTIAINNNTTFSSQTNELRVFTHNSIKDTVFTTATLSNSTTFVADKLKLSDDGNTMVICGGNESIYIYKKDSSGTYTRKLLGRNFNVATRFDITSDGSLLVAHNAGKYNVADTYWVYADISTIPTESYYSPVKLSFWDTSTQEASRMEFKFLSNNHLIFTAVIKNTASQETDYSGLYYMSDVRNIDTIVRYDESRDWSTLTADDFIATKDNKRIYFTGGWMDVVNKTIIADIPISVGDVHINATDTEIISVNGFYRAKSTLLFDNPEPLLFVTRQLETTSDEYSEIRTLRDKLTRATSVQRFDNNIWFASGHYTFHTLYNDPTYIPISSYNELGESFEHITGLSIVNDNILAAYKKNYIYIIAPITVGDSLTYSYTETKNIIGNDVLNAPILTSLTEMPTFVSYEGVYALNQLENVQSSDRIATLISENINPNWLKESKVDIDGCITMNRLYWTYFILPHKKTDGEKVDYTKIYLLDNRTQQWYYWELPLLCTNAFVKDNKTHLVDNSCKVYTLETTDLINEYNSDVTEYYDKIDKNKKIIPWHWNSQILSLSTINYSKRLVDTTFILTDTDTQDEYALDYSFKAWRKSVSETNASTINSNIHYVQSTTKRTMIPRFNFIQIRLSNTEDDLDNNKLRLVGLGLKYVLLEGLY